MAVRIVFFSDTHLGLDMPVHPRTQCTRRGPDFFANFERVLAHARDSGADLVIHGGDLFFRSRVHPAIVDRAYQAMLDCAGQGIPVVIVPGNHERSVLPPSLFLNHPDIHVFHGPGAFHFQLGSQTLTVSGFPYAHNVRGAFPELLRQCEPRSNADHHLLCIHHAIEGASVGPSGFTFRDRPDTIRRRDLPAWCNAVLSGHIHRHQTLLGPVPVLYCGSTERTSWAEKEETKGFCELTLKSGDKRVHSRFIPLPTRRMIDFDGRSYDSGPGLVDAVMTAAQDWQPHSLVRIHVDRWPARATSAALACRPFVTTWQCPQAGRSSDS